MTINLINQYLNNNHSQGRHHNNAFNNASPSISQTVYNNYESTNNLIKPLEGKGYLIENNLLTAPKEFARDTAYSAKALFDGTRGKANDHQIGKMNDLGLKIGGLAIATYLLTHKTTPKAKAMEFIGFGSFLASMALWPKLAIEIPTKLIHGFNFRQQYIDEQGRKKYATQDPNYIPFDLYRGDSKYTNLDTIGDKLGISRNIQNRQEEVKEEVRKISVQDNTLWMMTAGIATPTMTAVISNLAEKAVAPIAENLSNKSANKKIEQAYAYLTNSMNTKDKATFELKNLTFDSTQSEFSKKLDSIQGKRTSADEMNNIIKLFVEDFEPEMRDAAKEDISNIVGGIKSFSNNKSLTSLGEKINAQIGSINPNLANELTSEEISKALSDGVMRDAMHNMLSDIGNELLGNQPNSIEGSLSANLKASDFSNINFFEITEETKAMSQEERLAHNIQKALNKTFAETDIHRGINDLRFTNPELSKSFNEEIAKRSQNLAKSFYEGSIAAGNDTHYVLNSISNLYKSKAPRDAKHKKLFSSIYSMVETEQKATQGYLFNESAVRTLKEADSQLNKYRVFNEIFTKGAHLKVEMAPDTIAANSWNDVANLMIKELGISDKEISTASKSQQLTRELIEGKLEEVCSNDAKYSEFMKKIATKMAMFDEKMDTPNSGSSGRMMTKIENGITINCTEAGETLDRLGLNSMRKKMISSYSENMGVFTGSIMNSKLERLYSRVNGIHNSYMRILQTCEFFHRADKYSRGLANGADMWELSQACGFTQNPEMNKEIISKGKDLLLSAHTDKFYNKMATLNNPDFFKSLMWAMYRPSVTTPEILNATTEQTVSILDSIKIDGKTPRRTFSHNSNGRKPIGQSLKEFMEESYRSLGSIERRIVKPDREALRVDINEGAVTPKMQRATERFNLLGKAPSEMLHDALKQKYNSRKWMKIFAPILAGTFAATVGAQFLFGNKHKNVNS